MYMKATDPSPLELSDKDCHSNQKVILGHFLLLLEVGVETFYPMWFYNLFFSVYLLKFF